MMDLWGVIWVAFGSLFIIGVLACAIIIFGDQTKW